MCIINNHVRICAQTMGCFASHSLLSAEVAPPFVYVASEEKNGGTKLFQLVVPSGAVTFTIIYMHFQPLLVCHRVHEGATTVVGSHINNPEKNQNIIFKLITGLSRLFYDEMA